MQKSLNSIIRTVCKVRHGFKPIELEARTIYESIDFKEAWPIVNKLLEDPRYQVRDVGVFILGYMGSAKHGALDKMRELAIKDTSWQVHEILAKAFDQVCKDIGYQKSLHFINSWLSDPHPNINRVVTEGLRIWTNRPYFNTHPSVAIKLITQHRCSDSAYLRKSVGNALKDISKKHPELINDEIRNWDLKDERVLFTYKLLKFR